MKAIRHAGIVVKDLKKVLSFYKSLLGLKIVKKNSEPIDYINKVCKIGKAKAVTVKLKADDGNLIELVSFIPSNSLKNTRKKLDDPGLTHISFTVGDIDKEYRRLKRSGIRFNSIPQLSPDGYAKVVFCCDPEGNFIELVEVIKHG